MRFVSLAPDAAAGGILVHSVGAGGGSFHHGWTWHGSGPNTGTWPRRSLVLHAMSSEARYNPQGFGTGTGPIFSPDESSV